MTTICIGCDTVLTNEKGERIKSGNFDFALKVMLLGERMEKDPHFTLADPRDPNSPVYATCDDCLNKALLWKRLSKKA